MEYDKYKCYDIYYAIHNQDYKVLDRYPEIKPYANDLSKFLELKDLFGLYTFDQSCLFIRESIKFVMSDCYKNNCDIFTKEFINTMANNKIERYFERLYLLLDKENYLKTHKKFIEVIKIMQDIILQLNNMNSNDVLLYINNFDIKNLFSHLQTIKRDSHQKFIIWHGLLSTIALYCYINNITDYRYLYSYLNKNIKDEYEEKLELSGLLRRVNGDLFVIVDHKKIYEYLPNIFEKEDINIR